MIIRDKIRINAKPETIWEVIGDPSLMTLWNSKCLRCDPPPGDVQVGSQYQAVFAMRGPGREMWCEVLACEPPLLLATRYSERPAPEGRAVEETFRLSALPDGARLDHQVDLSRWGFPRWAVLLFKFVNFFGRKMNRSSLEGIRELAEALEADPNR